MYSLLCSILLSITGKMVKLDGKTLLVTCAPPQSIQTTINDRLPKLTNMQYHDWVQAINQQWAFVKRNGREAMAISIAPNMLIKFDDGITRYPNGSVWSSHDCDTDIIGIANQTQLF